MTRDQSYHPIFWIIYASPEKINSTLLKMSVDEINGSYYKGHTPLSFAIIKGSVHAVRRLIEKGADINHSHFNDYKPLLLAAVCGYEEIITTLILRPNIQPNITCRRQKNALILAICNNNTACAAALIASKKVNINHQDELGNTALMYAVLTHNQNITAQLAEQREIILKLKNHQSLTALDVATYIDEPTQVYHICRHQNSIPLFRFDQLCWITSQSLGYLIAEGKWYAPKDFLFLTFRPITLALSLYNLIFPSPLFRRAPIVPTKVKDAQSDCPYIHTIDLQPYAEIPRSRPRVGSL